MIEFRKVLAYIVEKLNIENKQAVARVSYDFIKIIQPSIENEYYFDRDLCQMCLDKLNDDFFMAFKINESKGKDIMKKLLLKLIEKNWEKMIKK